MLLECINSDFTEEQIAKIPNRPVRGELYLLRGRVHTVNGLGYLLEEITNPLLPNGVEPNFSSRRFKPIDEIDLTELTEVLEEEFTNQYYE